MPQETYHDILRQTPWEEPDGAILAEIHYKASVFWDRLQRLLSDTHTTTKEAARIAGMRHSTIRSGLEHGIGYPAREPLHRLAQYFDVSPRYLLPWGTPIERGNGWDPSRIAEFRAFFEAMPRRVRWKLYL